MMFCCNYYFMFNFNAKINDIIRMFLQQFAVAIMIMTYVLHITSITLLVNKEAELAFIVNCLVNLIYYFLHTTLLQ